MRDRTNSNKKQGSSEKKGASMFEDLEQGLLEVIEVERTGKGLVKRENMPTESYYIRRNP